MRRWMNHLRYFIEDAWDEFRHSPGVNLLAMGTLSAVLFLAGLIALVLGNIQDRADQLREEIRVAVDLEDDIAPAQMRLLQSRLEDETGVVDVEYVPKEEAVRRYRMWSAEQAELAGELDALPATLEVAVGPGRDPEGVADRIRTSLTGVPGVDRVRFDREWLGQLEGWLALARRAGVGLAVLVFITVGFIIASVLRLAVYSRIEEIQIMQLVGATPAFVRGPFLVAGLVLGVVSAVAALAIIEVVRRLIAGWLGPPILVDMVAQRPLSLTAAMWMLAIGVTVSLFSAYFAVRRTV